MRSSEGNCEMQAFAVQDHVPICRRRASLACPVFVDAHVQSAITTTSPRPLVKRPLKPVQEKLSSQLSEANSADKAVVSNTILDRTNSPTQYQSIRLNEGFDGHNRPVSASRISPIEKSPSASDDTNTSPMNSRERFLTDRETQEIPHVSKRLDALKCTAKKTISSDAAVNPTRSPNSPILSPVSSPTAAARPGSRPAVQKFSSSMDEPNPSPPRSSDHQSTDERLRRAERLGLKSPKRDGLKLLGPIEGTDSAEVSERQNKPLVERKLIVPRSSNSNGSITSQMQSPNSSSQIQSPNSSPRNIAKKMPKPAVDKLSSPLDAPSLSGAKSVESTGVNNVRRSKSSLTGAADLWSPSHRHCTHDSGELASPLLSAKATKCEPPERVSLRCRPMTRKALESEEEIKYEVRPSTSMYLGSDETEAQAESPSTGQQERQKRCYSASYSRPSRINSKQEPVFPPTIEDDQTLTSGVEGCGKDLCLIKIEDGAAQISPSVSLEDIAKNMTAPPKSEAVEYSDAEQVAREELKAVRLKMREMESKFRVIISQQDEEMAKERAEVAELGRQFAAACKLIENMKAQLHGVTEENTDLKSRLTNFTATAQEQASKSQSVSQAQSLDVTDANKKVRLAQEQMAKLIARHNKEIAGWSSTCEDLKREVACSKSVESQLNREIDLLRQIVKHLEGKQGKESDAINESKGIDAATQTKQRQPRSNWDPWIWLVSLAIWTSNKTSDTVTIEIQTDLSLSSSFKPKMKDCAVMTMQEIIHAESDWDRWWSGILDCAEEELKTLKFKGKTQLSKAQILSLITNVYAGKIVQDEVDDREGLPRMHLTNFLHLYFLDQKGSALTAQKSMAIIIANLLAHLRGHNFSNFGSEHIGEDAETSLIPAAVRSHALAGKCARMILFARFLGLKHEGLEPISLDGLSLYLAALARSQKGQIPLLPVSGEKVLVSLTEYVQTLDWIFAQSRAITRESAKVGLLTTKADPLNLESALEYTLDQWKECESKGDARLEALFSTVMAVADFSFEIFDEMMQKLKVDEPVLPGHTARLRMFQELCMYPKVDSGVFSSIAKKYGILKFNVGNPSGMTKLDVDTSALFDSLEPLYSAAHKSITAKLPELDQQGYGRGLERKWAICGDLLRERESPEKAWIFYYMVTRQYSAAMRQFRTRSDKTAANASGLNEFELISPDGSHSFKKVTQKEPANKFGRLPSSQ